MTTYIEYLQQLLQQHQIPYLSSFQYQSPSKTIQKINLPLPPFKTNITQDLPTDLINRYSRQMLLKQIQYQGQIKISKTKIALIGSGGIGCPLGLYLGAAGVGTLGLFDSDSVDITNLHRQIAHKTNTIGKNKTQSLKQSILTINPNITIQKHPFITVQNSYLLDNYDIVIDGSDNPTCRYIVNDHCMKNNRKLLSGACVGWQAQITCYGGESPCYRCIWGNQQVSMGNCSSLGVVGMLPGLVALILATQALKLIVKGQSSLQGKMLTYQGRNCEFRKVSLRKKQKQCIACGQNKLNMKSYDYSRYAGCSSKTAVPECPEISWQQFTQSHKQASILDVRPQNNYNIVHLSNSKNIPCQKLVNMSKQQLELEMKQFNSGCIFVSCTRGVMSKIATKHLNQQGYNAKSIKGGILKYRKDFDPSLPQL